MATLNTSRRLIQEVSALCDYLGTARVLREEYAGHAGTAEKIAECETAATLHAFQAWRLSLLLPNDATV
jgi:hypothetical protein